MGANNAVFTPGNLPSMKPLSARRSRRVGHPRRSVRGPCCPVRRSIHTPASLASSSWVWTGLTGLTKFGKPDFAASLFLSPPPFSMFAFAFAAITSSSFSASRALHGALRLSRRPAIKLSGSANNSASGKFALMLYGICNTGVTEKSTKLLHAM